MPTGMALRAAGGAHSAVREKAGLKTLHNRSQPQRWRFPCSNASHRINLLLAICTTVALFLLARHASSIMGWHLQPHGSRSPVSRNSYTVLVNTWKRDDLLKKSVAHYASCDSVNSIRIVWSEDEPPSDALRSFLMKAVRHRSNDPEKPFFRFDINEDNNLNNRFKPIEGLTTDAIFSIDDDVLLPCSTLEFAFTVWQTAPESMVGFVPRMHWVDTKKHGSKQPLYIYGGWWSVWWMGTYSMVLTKAAFFHHKYLEIYTNEMLASIRSFVRDGRNCEDIAMSFLVANITGAPPIWVKGRIFEIGSTGISSLKGHSKHRTVCLNYFVSLYGDMPLVASNAKAVDAHHEWFW